MSNLEEAFEPFKQALHLNETDTLGRATPDDDVLFILEGSWTGSKTVTLGDLRRLAKAVAAAANPVIRTKVIACGDYSKPPIASMFREKEGDRLTEYTIGDFGLKIRDGDRLVSYIEEQ